MRNPAHRDPEPHSSAPEMMCHQLATGSGVLAPPGLLGCGLASCHPLSDLGKPPNIPKPQFPHLSNGDNISFHSSPWGWWEDAEIRCLLQTECCTCPKGLRSGREQPPADSVDRVSGCRERTHTSPHHGPQQKKVRSHESLRVPPQESEEVKGGLVSGSTHRKPLISNSVFQKGCSESLYDGVPSQQSQPLRSLNGQGRMLQELLSLVSPLRPGSRC